jgi:hypothetical protein
MRACDIDMVSGHKANRRVCNRAPSGYRVAAWCTRLSDVLNPPVACSVHNRSLTPGQVTWKD